MKAKNVLRMFICLFMVTALVSALPSVSFYAAEEVITEEEQVEISEERYVEEPAEEAVPVSDETNEGTAFMPQGSSDEGTVFMSQEASEEPKIIKQPVDCDVIWPVGALFEIEVEDPDNVASYQWICTDNIHEFTLSGTSAKTATLHIPSTMQDDGETYYYCVVTDKEGRIVTSDRGKLTVSGKETDKTVLYVGNFAVLPGQSLDLSGIGKGRVTFHENGTEITLSNVEFDNANAIFDTKLYPGMGIRLFREHNEAQNYTVHLEGENSIINSFENPKSAGNGITFDLLMQSGTVRPTLTVDGSGSLYIKGGDIALRAQGVVDLDAPLTIEPNGDDFCDGIYSDGVILDSGVTLNLNVNGTAIFTDNDVTVSGGSALVLNSCAPAVHNGDTNKAVLHVNGNLNVKDSRINISGTADPARFDPPDRKLNGFIGILMGGAGSLSFDNSDVTIDMSAADGTDYAFHFSGITGVNAPTDLVFSDSRINISVESESVLFADGIYALGDITAEEGSKLDVMIRAKGTVYGVATEADLTVTDSSMNVDVESVDGSEAYGILSDAANIEINNETYIIEGKAKNGIGFVANTDEKGDIEKKYDKDYKATKITLAGKARCITPKSNAISTASIPGSGNYYLYLETFYDLNDTSAPAQEVVIAAEGIAYTFSEGADSTWTKASGKDVKLVVNRSVDDDTAFSHFKEIRIDGNKLADSDYKAEAGSLKATIYAKALDTLVNGSHSVEVLFDDGSASTSLTVKPQAAPTVTPSPEPTTAPYKKKAANTGDQVNPAWWFILLSASTAVLMAAVYKRQE